MSNQVTKKEEVELFDGKVVEVRSLPIKRLRKFWKVWGEGFARIAENSDKENVDSEDDGMTVYVDVVGVCLSHNFVDEYENLWATPVAAKKGAVLSKEYQEYLEENLDMPVIYEVIRVAADLDLEDPKLTQAMEAVQNGRTST